MDVTWGSISSQETKPFREICIGSLPWSPMAAAPPAAEVGQGLHTHPCTAGETPFSPCRADAPVGLVRILRGCCLSSTGRVPGYLEYGIVSPDEGEESKAEGRPHTWSPPTPFQGMIWPGALLP